jgi:predicted nucleotidyltransferase
VDRAEVIAKLKEAEPALRKYGIAALYLFGSYARGEARPGSDVDVFVDKAKGRRFGFDELMGGYRTVREALPDVEVSFGTREGLSRHIRKAVEEQAIRVF